MYKVRNITNGKVILGDIGIVFNHGEEKDLDKVLPRVQIERSQNLKAAIHYGKLSLPLKDDIEPAAPATTTFFMPPAEVTPDHLSDMEQRIKAHLEQYMKKQSPTPNTSPTPEVQQKLDAIIKLLAQGTPTQTTSPGETETVEDDDKLVDIQMRALQRITKNAEGQIAAKEEKKDSSVSDRADELEGLL